MILNTIHHGDFVKKGKLLKRRGFGGVIADPPYNIGKDFGNDTDRQELSDYLQSAKIWLAVCFEHLDNNGIIYVYGFAEILACTAAEYPINRQRWLVWRYTNKTVPGLKLWQTSRESILCLWQGRWPTLLVDGIREEYAENYKKVIGKTRKDTQ